MAAKTSPAARTPRAALLWVLGALCVSGATTARADEAAGAAAVRVAKQLAQEDSYRLTASVRGGKARGDDHQLVDVTVDEAYVAEVAGKLGVLSAPCQAFRLRADAAKGAVRDGTRWMAILATDAGRKAARLCPGPEAVLVRALRWKQRAEWVAPAAPASAPQPSAGAADVDAPEPGGTATREGGTSSAGEAPSPAPASQHIRIEAPAQVAVEAFIEIVNSGCFSAG